MLSHFAETLESGAEKEIVFRRNGVPVARLAPISTPARAIRFGLAEGMSETPMPDPLLEEEAAALFRNSK